MAGGIFWLLRLLLRRRPDELIADIQRLSGVGDVLLQMRLTLLHVQVELLGLVLHGCISWVAVPVWNACCRCWCTTQHVLCILGCCGAVGAGIGCAIMQHVCGALVSIQQVSVVGLTWCMVLVRLLTPICVCRALPFLMHAMKFVKLHTLQACHSPVQGTRARRAVVQLYAHKSPSTCIALVSVHSAPYGMANA